MLVTISAMDTQTMQHGEEVSGEALTQLCFDRLSHHEKTVEFDPLTNSVRQLAHELHLKEVKGEITVDQLINLQRYLTTQSLADRAEQFAERVFSDTVPVTEILNNAGTLSIEEFSDMFCRQRYGIVFTAHPTFGLSREATEHFKNCIASFLNNSPQTGGNGALPAEKFINTQITIEDEHFEAMGALTNAQDALTDIVREILREARSRFPDHWETLIPTPVSLASWVGYDLDGRTDISWNESLSIRLSEKKKQLEYYSERLAEIDIDHIAQASQLRAQLRKAIEIVFRQIEAFQNDLTDPEAFIAAANILSENSDCSLADPRPCLEKLTELIELPQIESDLKLELCVLRAILEMMGAGTSLIHFRVNAAQVKSAIRHEFEIEQDLEFVDRTTFDLVSEHTENVESTKINTASVFYEHKTARRQLMLCTQFLKHVDTVSPIRFLVAETETPATVLGVLYLAKRYGIEKDIDISPLFETPSAIENAGRFVQQLLKSKVYQDYLEKRGRVCIQIGFSDSGRFMGQVGANLAIERLQSQFLDALSQAGLCHLDVIIFNTHGESMGRGGFPGSIKERCNYLLTPWVRKRYQEKGVHLIAESSFQGGDGYLRFATPNIATQTVGDIFAWSMQSETTKETVESDNFYDQFNFTWDVYQRIIGWQKELFDRKDYQVALGSFAFNVLPVTGSRKARRQSGSTLMGPKSLRAIPHNAILHQLAVPANVFGGIGSSVGHDLQPVLEQISGSERFEQIISIAREARRLTSLPVLRAYAVLFDPEFWSAKASSVADRSVSENCTEIAENLDESTVALSIRQLSTHLSFDLSKFDRLLSSIYGDEEDQSRYDYRRPLHALHAVRQSLIMRAFILVTRVPSFSLRMDIDRSELFQLAFSLRFDVLADRLSELFPMSSVEDHLANRLTERADPLQLTERGYAEINRNLITPLRRIHESLQEASLGIANFYGAYG